MQIVLFLEAASCQRASAGAHHPHVRCRKCVPSTAGGPSTLTSKVIVCRAGLRPWPHSRDPTEICWYHRRAKRIAKRNGGSRG